MRRYAEIIVDVAHSNVDKIFDYLLPEGMDVSPGSRVFVPFGRTKVEGTVLRIKNQSEVPESKLKVVLSKIDEQPLLTGEQMELAKRVRETYRTTLAFALRLMYPADMRGGRVDKHTVKLVRVKDADKLNEMRHRQKLARMVLENQWYEQSDTKQSEGFFKDLPASSKPKIARFPRMYYRMENGLLHITAEITLGKFQEPLLHLENKLESGLYCELISRELLDGFVEYTLLYDMIANRIPISEVRVAKCGSCRTPIGSLTACRICWLRAVQAAAKRILS